MRGGKRAGAGAPRANLNALKHGGYRIKRERAVKRAAAEQRFAELQTRYFAWRKSHPRCVISTEELAEILNEQLALVLGPGNFEGHWLVQGHHFEINRKPPPSASPPPQL